MKPLIYFSYLQSFYIFHNSIEALTCLKSVILRVPLKNFSFPDFREEIRLLRTEKKDVGETCEVQLYHIYDYLHIWFGDNVHIEMDLQKENIHFDVVVSFDLKS